MKKFIGAMILGVVVVIYMVIEMNREYSVDEPTSPNAMATDDSQWDEPQQAKMRPASGQSQADDQSFASYHVATADNTDVEMTTRESDNGYVPPQPSSLAEVEAKRDRNPTGRNTINLDLVPYQLEFEPVDYQWFREMEQALYSIAYEVLEPVGARMVNLECATSVCVADFDVPSHADVDTAAFGRAAQEMELFDKEQLSMVYLSSQGVLERIIFQRKE